MWKQFTKHITQWTSVAQDFTIARSGLKSLSRNRSCPPIVARTLEPSWAAPHPFEARFLLEVIFRVATELWPSGRRAKLERGGVRSFLEERSGYRFECGATFAPPSLPPRLYTFLFFSNPSRCETRTEYPIRNGARFLEIMILELFQWPLHSTYSLLTCRGLRATFFFVKYLNWRGLYRVNKRGIGFDYWVFGFEALIGRIIFI